MDSDGATSQLDVFSDHDAAVSKKKSKHRKPKYRSEWELIPEFKTWLRPVKDDNYKCRCLKCTTEFVSEISTIKYHAKSSAHKLNMESVQLSSKTSMESFLNLAPAQKLNEQVLKAEIKFSAFLSEHNIAFNVADHLQGLMKNMFPDSKICEKMKIKRTKATCIVKNVIAPFEKQNLINNLSNTKFSIMIDESTDIACTKTMCIIVRFFSSQQQRVISRFWDLVQIYGNDNCEDINSGATAANLFNICVESFQKHNIPLENTIGFGSDGCNAMMGQFNSVSSRMRDLFPGLFVMKCICHSLHLVSSEACKVLPRRCEDLARQIYSFFSQSCKRQCQFKEFQKFLDIKVHKILHPSQTRWLSLSSVVTRIIEQWEPLKLFFIDKWATEKLGVTESIVQQLNDPFTKAYYLFLEWILPKFANLNQYFQTSKVVLNVLHEKMVITYKELLCTFLKHNYVMQTPIHMIDPSDNSMILRNSELYLGVKVATWISQKVIIQRPDLLNDFKKRCQEFIKESCLQIKKRYDFSDPILPLLNVLSPKVALSSKQRSTYPTLSNLCLLLPRIVDPSNENLIQIIDDQWRSLPFIQFPKNITNEESVDVFWAKILNYKSGSETKDFYELGKFCLDILTLPHSNADCERLFSKINRTKTSSRNRLITSTVASTVMTSECVSFSSVPNGNCVHFEPNKNLMDRMTSSNLYPKHVIPTAEDEAALFSS